MPDIEHIQIGDTIYDIKDSSKAPLESPQLTGTPSAPTPEQETDNEQIATTEFVHDAIEALDIDVQSRLAGKSDTDHDHAGTYYTEAEMDEALAEKMDAYRRTVSGNVSDSCIEIQDAIPGKSASLSASFDFDHNTTDFADAWSEGFRKNKLPVTISDVLYLNPQYTFNKGINGWSAYSTGYDTATFYLIWYKDDEAIKRITINRFLYTTETIVLYDGGPFDLDENATYILSGTSAAANSGNSIKIIADNVEIASDEGSGATFLGSAVTEAEHVRVVITYTKPMNIGSVNFYPMIRLSSVLDSTYEPYRFVNDIPSASSLSITRIGKNLFDPSAILSSEENIFLINDEFVGKAQDFANLGLVEIKGFSNKQTVFSITGYSENESGADANSGTFYIGITNSGGGMYTCIFNLCDTSPVSKTPSSPLPGSDVYYFYFGGSDLENHNDTWHFKFAQLEIGTEQTDYEPYNEDTVSINFPASIGNIVKGSVDLSTRKIIINKKYLNGYYLNVFSVEDIYVQPLEGDPVLSDSVKVTVQTYGTLETPLSPGVSNTLISNRFSINFDPSEAGYCNLSNDGVLTFNILRSQLSNTEVDGVEEWLQEHPTHFVYELVNDEIDYNLRGNYFSFLDGYNIVYSNSKELSFTYPYSPFAETEQILDNFATKNEVQQAISDATSALQTEINAKPDTASLGDFAFEDDAPTDNKAYNRKNGEWVEAESGGGGSVSAWGDLTGNIEDQTDLQNALDDKADIIITNASGSLVNIKDAGAYPVEELKVSLVPVQDLNGYDSPWPAGGGINIWPLESLTLSGFNIPVSETDYPEIWAVAQSLDPNGTYRIFSGSGATWISFNIFYSDNTHYYIQQANAMGTIADLSGGTVTITEIRIQIGDQTAGERTSSKMMLAKTSTAITAYTPYSNICPISGHTQTTVMRTGKNLFSYQTIPAYAYAWYSGSTSLADASQPIRIKGGQKYVLSSPFTDATDLNSLPIIRAWRINGTILEDEPNVLKVKPINVNGYYTYMSTPKFYAFQGSYTVGTNPFVIYIESTEDLWLDIRMKANGGVGAQPQLELGEISTVYEEYNDQLVTIQLGSTVYGATLDVKNGTMRVTHGMVDLGTLNWYRETSADGRFYSNGIQSAISGTDFICEAYPKGASTINYQMQVSAGGYIYVKNLSYATANEFKASLSGVKFVYPLAEPVTVQLSPETLTMLLGSNVVWTSTGDIENIKYRADTKLYIDQHGGGTVDAYTKAETDTKLAAKANLASPALTGNPTAPTQSSGNNSTRIATTAFVQTAISSKADKSVITYTESAMTATRNYSIGDLIIVGTNLYKVTASISSGTSLSTSSNVVATTLAAENALKANAADVYSKTDVDTLLSGKSDTDHEHNDIYYTKPGIDAKLNRKADLKTEFVGSGPVMKFNAVNDHQISDMLIDIDPVQDLHGYDSPWPAGGGKNKFQTTVTTQTINGKTFTVNSDGSITATGTATASVGNFILGEQPLTAGSYKVNGLANGGASSFRVVVQNISTSPVTILATLYSGLDAPFTLSEDATVRMTIICPSGDGSNYTVYPMIRDASISDASWAPYSNICPITGHTTATVTRTGRNLWDEEWVIGHEDIDTNTGEIITPSVSTWYFRSKNYIPVSPSTTYFDVNPNVPSNYRLFYYDADKNYISYISHPHDTVFTTPSNARYMMFRFASSSDYTYQNNISINYPATDTEYHAHAGNISVTVDLEGTRYSGILDVSNGVLTVDKGIITFDGSEDETWFRNSAARGIYFTGISDMKSGNVMMDGKANWLKTVTGSSHFGVMFGSNNNYIYCYQIEGNMSEITDLTTWRTYLASHNLQVMYPLAEPIEVPLTPATISTLIGQNTIWADTGDISVSLSVPIDSMAYEKTENKADVIFDTASGAIASFEDGAPYPVEELTVDINPVQDLHGYDSPWPAGGGKNKLDPSAITWKKWYLNNNLLYPLADEQASISYSISGDEITITTTANNRGICFEIGAVDYDRIVSQASQVAGSIILAEAYAQASPIINSSQLSASIPANTSGCVAIRCGQAGTYTVKLQLESGSSATSYSPYSNICPISGHTSATVTRSGKNLLPMSLLQNGTWEDTDWRISGADSAVFRSIKIWLKAGTYTFSAKDVAIRVVRLIKDGTYSSADVKTFTTTSDGYVGISWRDNTSASTAWDDSTPLQLELGSTATPYEPYQGTSVTIDLGEERYGGVLDVKNGVLRIEWMKADLSQKNWSYTDHRFNTASVLDPTAVAGNHAFCFCSRYKSNTGSATRTSDFSISVANNGYVYVYDTSYTGTKEEFKAMMSDVDFIYKLATPIEVPLSAEMLTTLLGKNNIWSDTGDAHAKYRADTKLYIQKLTQPSEDDMTANANIANGKFFMVGNNLYFSTSAIAAGTTILPGTNCTRLSLADALNNLNS